jgi:hypothetical protein
MHHIQTVWHEAAESAPSAVCGASTKIMSSPHRFRERVVCELLLASRIPLAHRTPTNNLRKAIWTKTDVGMSPPVANRTSSPPHGDRERYQMTVLRRTGGWITNTSGGFHTRRSGSSPTHPLQRTLTPETYAPRPKSYKGKQQI